MMSKTGDLSGSEREFDFLCVDDFMERMIDSRALATAFEIGLIDSLARDGKATTESLAETIRTDSRGLHFLIDLLLTNGVVELNNGSIALTPAFVKALRFRDLMEIKLSISNFAAHDFLEFFTDLVAAPDQFMSKARFHRLFAYDRCFSFSQEDRRITEQWMRITTVLTKYEARACLKYHDFSAYGRMLDIGGNSGEFVLQLCREHSDLHAAVFDLPLVCDVGRNHLAGEPERSRIDFVTGNAATDDLPGGFDLVTFKSMLHDWPDDLARDLMKKGARALEPGGAMVIFERAAYVPGALSPGHSILPFLIFFHSYRASDFYVRYLEELGFSNIESRIINLEMPFILVTGVRGDGG